MSDPTREAGAVQPPETQCSLCSFPDGLVQEWVSKVREQARAKGWTDAKHHRALNGYATAGAPEAPQEPLTAVNERLRRFLAEERSAHAGEMQKVVDGCEKTEFALRAEVARLTQENDARNREVEHWVGRCNVLEQWRIQTRQRAEVAEAKLTALIAAVEIIIPDCFDATASARLNAALRAAKE